MDNHWHLFVLFKQFAEYKLETLVGVEVKHADHLTITSAPVAEMFNFDRRRLGEKALIGQFRNHDY